MQRLFDLIGVRLTGRGDFSAQYLRYRETIRWLINDLLAFDRRTTVLAVIFNILGGILKTGALAFLLYYASLMEAGDVVHLAGYSLEPRSVAVFYIAVSIAVLLLFCGAIAVYAGSSSINRLSIAFASHCSQYVLLSSGGRPAGNPPPSEKNYPSRLSNNVTCVIWLSRAIKPLLQVTNPFSTLIYSLILLFYLNALLSLVMMILVLPTMFLQYKVNFQSAQNEKQLMTGRSKGLRRLNRLLDETALTPKFYQGATNWLRQEYRTSTIGNFLQYFYRRLMAPVRSALVSDLLLAALSLFMVIYLGHKALLGDIGWTQFLGYILFARICLQALRGVLVSITGFARHYPRARRIYEFFRSLAYEVQVASTDINIVARGRNGIGNMGKIKMQPGIPLQIVSPAPLSRFNLYVIIDALSNSNISDKNALAAATTCISSGMDSLPGGSIDELLGIHDSDPDEDIEARLLSVGLPGDYERSRLLTPELWRQLVRKTRARILLQQPQEQVAPLVLVDSAVLIASGSDFASRWLASMAACRVAIVYGHTQQLPADDDKVAVLIAQNRSVSIATTAWCHDNMTEINNWLCSNLADAEEAQLDDDMLDEW